MKYSVTTVCLPEMTMQEQAELLSKLGYDGMELRVRRVTPEQRQTPPSCWGFHVNDITPENFRSKAGEIRSILSDYGLQLGGLASAAACTDLEQIKLLVEGCVEAGAPFFRVGAAAGYNGTRPYREIFGETIAGYESVLGLTKGTDVKILLEIHGGTIHPSASMAHRIVSHFDPARVGVIYDPQNMVRDGFETTALAVDLLGPYIAHCHVGAHRPHPGDADEQGTTKWQWERCRMGEGLYNFPTMLRELKKIDYRNFISIEDFGASSPEEKFADAIAYLKAIEE